MNDCWDRKGGFSFRNQVPEMGQKKPWAQPVLRDKCQLPQLPANGFIMEGTLRQAGKPPSSWASRMTAKPQEAQWRPSARRGEVGASHLPEQQNLLLILSIYVPYSYQVNLWFTLFLTLKYDPVVTCLIHKATNTGGIKEASALCFLRSRKLISPFLSVMWQSQFGTPENSVRELHLYPASDPGPSGVGAVTPAGEGMSIYVVIHWSLEKIWAPQRTSYTVTNCVLFIHVYPEFFSFLLTNNKWGEDKTRLFSLLK